VRRRLIVTILSVALLAGACSTRVYSSDRAVRDLERMSSLTHTQATCIVTQIRLYFSRQIKATQKANKGSPLPADRLKLEIDGALAGLHTPSGPQVLAARRAIAKCAPAKLE
jgi:hypothetical protein